MITRRTVLAAATLAAGAVTLLAAGCTGHPAAATPQPSAPAPATTATTPAVSPPGPIASSPPAKGVLFYTDGDRLLRGRTTVLSSGGYTANVSPDGTSIALVDTNNNVVVAADSDGQHKRTVLPGSVGVGYEPPGHLTPDASSCPRATEPSASSPSPQAPSPPWPIR
jgi:hypothetical protein